MSEAETKAAKPKAEVTQVSMTDGRSVGFAGKKRLDKEIIIEGENVSVRFDFRNGETRTLDLGDVPEAIQLQLLGHGASQKVGDECAGEEDVDDMVLAVDGMIGRLLKGEWSTARQAGDSSAGGSLVVKALAEVTGKSVQAIKDFLQGKLDADKAAGGKLTRQALYASFRVPGNPVAAVIERMEAEKRAKSVGAVSANDLLSELS